MPSRTKTLAAASMVLVAGCSSHSSHATAAGAELGPPCTIASAALVNGKLGFALTGPNVDRGPTATICTYDNPSNQAQAATVQLQYEVTPASFAAGRTGFSSHGEKVSDVPGLADEAYAAALTIANVTNNTLVARKGTQAVLITSTATADRLPDLMSAILALL